MSTLNDWGVKNLGEWVTANATLFLIAALAFFILFVVTVIIAIVVGFKKSQKIKKLKAENAIAQYPDSDAADASELEQRIRAELYPQIYAEVQNELAANGANDDNNVVANDEESNRLNAQISAMSDRIDAQDAELAEKQARIDELTAALADAGDNGSADYERKIDELNRKIKDKESEINLLKAENSQIKAQALQQQLADRDRKAAESAKPAEKQKEQPQRKQPIKQPEPQQEVAAADEEDEYDEYYDDFGDASSAVKVTLKFDRAKNSWIILRSDTDRTYRRMATKQDALVVAKDLARRLHAQLVVHKKDGKFQKI